jgi:phage terminase small subunit
MTLKQQRFAEEYLLDWNGTRAALRAGYSPRTARAIASENLTKPDIQTAIAQARVELSERTQITVERVVLELARIAFSQITHAASWDDHNISLHASETLDEETAAAIRAIVIRCDKDGTPTFKQIKMHDKLQALHLLGQYLEVWKEGHGEQPPQTQPNWLAVFLDAVQSGARGAEIEGSRKELGPLLI